MRLTSAQVISLFNLMMDFTRDATFEILSMREDGEVTVRVSNRYGTRGFTVPPQGGRAVDVPAMNHPSDELKVLVGLPTALEGPNSNDDTLGDEN